LFLAPPRPTGHSAVLSKLIGRAWPPAFTYIRTAILGAGVKGNWAGIWVFRLARDPTETARSVKGRRLIVTYLAAERSMPPFFRARLRYLRSRVDDCRLLREMDVVARLALQRHLRKLRKKAAAARCWDCCHFKAPHRGGPERALPNIWNNEKVFSVF
jgi:hypothetical protein